MKKGGKTEKPIKTVKGAVKAAEKAAQKEINIVEEEKKGGEVVAAAAKTDSLNA